MPKVAIRTALGLLFVLTGCLSEPDDAVEPAFPEDYDLDYTEVRDCRGSGDHDLNKIRILVSPDAVGPYVDRDASFPVDAIVLKEEYDFGDVDCTGPIKQWTVMQRLEAGSSTETLDWAWQRVDFERNVVEEDTPKCYGCHQGCGVAPDGYEGTCAMP